MLAITRKVGEEIKVDGDIRIVVLQIKGNRVRIGIDAPQSTRIIRAEIDDTQPRRIDELEK